MRLLFIHKRQQGLGQEGIPILDPPPGPPQLGEYGLFKRQRYLLGITDPLTVEAMWQEEKAKNPVKKRGRRDTNRAARADRSD